MKDLRQVQDFEDTRCKTYKRRISWKAGGCASLLQDEMVQRNPLESRVHLSESVYKVGWQKSIPAQIRQHILHNNDKLTDL